MEIFQGTAGSVSLAGLGLDEVYFHLEAQLKTLCETHDDAERAVACGMLRRFATHPPASVLKA